MIIIKIKGGLGNQLFQIAFGYYLANKYNVRLCVDYTWYNSIPKNNTRRKLILEKLDIKIPKLNFKEKIICLFYNFKIIKFLKINKPFNFITDNDFKKVKIFDNLYLDGYWQTYEYKDFLIDNILNTDLLLNRMSLYSRNCLDEIKVSNSVGIHIRRGDYVTDKKTNLYHNVLTIDYYFKSIQIIRKQIKDPKFFFFSDDIEWVKENFKNDHFNFISSNDIDEFLLLANCKNLIIANSTYSLWAAYLVKYKNKIIIAPKYWGNFNYSEKLIPLDWLRV